MATKGLTALHRKVRNSGTERMSRALILKAGTGAFEGAAGVKTAKLFVEQDQIGGLFLTMKMVRIKCGQHEALGLDR